MASSPTVEAKVLALVEKFSSGSTDSDELSELIPIADDWVEFLHSLSVTFGISLASAHLRKMCTIRDCVNIITKLVGEKEEQC